ncbi:MAG: hypothetical protein M0C28_21895 [Candidatus Moduliflexus flocculans]|nr:hypothetical protein [Candidatus Moduliflexus flocculans]
MPAASGSRPRIAAAAAWAIWAGRRGGSWRRGTWGSRGPRAPAWAAPRPRGPGPARAPPPGMPLFPATALQGSGYAGPSRGSSRPSWELLGDGAVAGIL